MKRFLVREPVSKARSIGPQVQFVVMPERTFRILAYVDKVPSMASCNKCQRKFFTPGGMFRRDPVMSEGEPMLIVHGAEGGFDQGIDMTSSLLSGHSRGHLKFVWRAGRRA